MRWGGLAWADHNDCTICLDDFNGWIENFILHIITHETIHLAISKTANYETSCDFDNIFGDVNHNVILSPQLSIPEESVYERLVRQRCEEWWNNWSKKAKQEKK